MYKNETKNDISKRLAIKLKRLVDLEGGDTTSLIYIEGRVDQMLQNQEVKKGKK